MNEQQEAFRQAADLLDELPTWLKAARSARKIGCREASVEIGVSPPVVSRVERGIGCSALTAGLILRWLGRTS